MSWSNLVIERVANNKLDWLWHESGRGDARLRVNHEMVATKKNSQTNLSQREALLPNRHGRLFDELQQYEPELQIESQYSQIERKLSRIRADDWLND